MVGLASSVRESITGGCDRSHTPHLVVSELISLSLGWDSGATFAAWGSILCLHHWLLRTWQTSPRPPPPENYRQDGPLRRHLPRMLSCCCRVTTRCGCGEIGIRGGLKIRWGFPRCRFESDQPHHFFHSPLGDRPGQTLHSFCSTILTPFRPVEHQTAGPILRVPPLPPRRYRERAESRSTLYQYNPNPFH